MGYFRGGVGGYFGGGWGGPILGHFGSIFERFQFTSGIGFSVKNCIGLDLGFSCFSYFSKL